MLGFHIYGPGWLKLQISHFNPRQQEGGVETTQARFLVESAVFKEPSWRSTGRLHLDFKDQKNMVTRLQVGGKKYISLLTGHLAAFNDEGVLLVGNKRE